jgi:hypothetical protein
MFYTIIAYLTMQSVMQYTENELERMVKEAFVA